jgi:flagellar biosynthesis GTPase FlhF
MVLETTSRWSAARLPKRLLPLVGCECELKTLKNDLANPNRRIITIVGPGGVGKTSLATEAAWQAVFDNDASVIFVDLERLQLSAESKQLLEKALAQLRGMQTADSDIFKDLALDFLAAAGFLFANSNA